MEHIYACLLTSDGARVSNERCKRYPKLIEELFAKHQVSTVAEALYLELANLSTEPRCECGAVCKFYNFKRGYAVTCSQKACVAREASKRTRAHYANESNRKALKASMPKRVWTDEQKAKQRATNIQRYGVTSPLALPSVRAKAAETVQGLGGLSSLMKVSGSAARNRELAAASFINIKLPMLRAEGLEPLFDSTAYGGTLTAYRWRHLCGHEFISTLESGKIPKCPKCAPRSGPQQLLAEALQAKLPLGYELRQNTRKLLQGKELDILISKHGRPMLAIEVNGVYWHSTDVNPNHKHMQEKHDSVERLGFQLLTFYDTEVLQKLEIVLSMCMAKLGLSERVHARKLEVSEVQVAEARAFLEANHLQGYISSSVRLGLYDNDTLMQVMTVGAARFRAGRELLRLASKVNITVIGGMSKLLARMPKGERLISYANRRWSAGAAYEANGFQRLANDSPSYWYYKHNVGLLSRYQCQKHKLPKLLGHGFDQSLSETANMAANGFLKIYDAGSLTYEFIGSSA